MYTIITVNGWEVAFRTRDINRIKIAHAKKRDIDKSDECTEFDTDDCTGDEFAKFLAMLLLA